MSPIIGINNFHKKNRPDSTSAENIDSPNFTNIEKVYAHSSDKHQYAGFQILDWNSNFQSPLVRTSDKLLRIFTHKDPVYYKVSLKKRTMTVP